jgi:hypothetical protein
MTAIGILFAFVMIALVALMLDHHSRLKKFGWAPQDAHEGRSALDPVGSALGELGRADMPHKALAAVFGGSGKGSEMLDTPIGAGLSGVGKALEMVFAPIGAVLGMIGGANR